jgi:hypothetical protein
MGGQVVNDIGGVWYVGGGGIHRFDLYPPFHLYQFMGVGIGF